ncbi:secreted RxLR effector protein 161-like [Bombus pyrosoma]|uniref:secreted RxLR effector protein 161-like n=1 Tax=Bombus pyrosoma TaxID=396416 RepID=UPI001CB8946E|nr:secreted RxLR effector protein 161-like [Bombus pyrosoma]
MLDLFDITHEVGVSTPLAKECETGFDIKCNEPFDNKLYEQAVGHIMYVATVSRPDVACAIGKLSQRCANTTVSNWKAVRRIFKYLLKTKDLELVYQRTGQPLKVFCDSDFAGRSVDRKSRSGYVFILAGGATSWLSKKQPIIFQSTCEAEFVAMQEAARETVWISLLLRELGQLSYCPRPCKIFCDNIGAISWPKDEVIAESSKHVQVRYFYVKNCVSKGILYYTYIPSSENVADIFTKGLNRVKTQIFTKAMGLVETTIKGEC